MSDSEIRQYVELLQASHLAAFGCHIREDECREWYEVDATVDQAIEWINHGAGPGDYAGCADKENAWQQEE